MPGVDLTDTTTNLVALCGVLSFTCVILIIVLLYMVCTRKYRLNWFEKNLLEAADSKDLRLSQETFVDIQDNSADIKSLFADCTSDVQQWAQQPQTSQVSEDATSWGAGNSMPTSPTSCSSYQLTFPGGNVPMARNDNQIVLTNSSPAKPRIATMQAKLDHTKIDSSLYHNETAGEPEDIRGSVHVGLTYDPIAGILTVRLIEARDLQATGSNGSINPYAKIRLLPNKTNVWQTRIHKKSLCPVFDEDFVFEVRAIALCRNTLEVLLYNFDAYSRHHSIGAAQIPLANVDLNEKVDIWRPIGPLVDQDPKVDLGELMVSLAYLPSAERLTVVVIKARNLRVVDDTRNSSDPYVKVCMVTGGKRIKKKKTGVHRNTVSPVINEALTFDIDKETLKKSSIEFYVMHDSLLGASEVLGKCKVGRTPDCRQEEKEFFHEMLHSKTATAQWLTLSEYKHPKQKDAHLH